MSRVHRNGFRTFWGNIFFDIFLDPVTKPRSQGFDPDLFMTELPCHQLGAKIKWVILTFRPGSTYQHQKNKFSCRCGDRDLFLSPVPPVLPLILFFRKNTISGKTKPLERVNFRSFLTIFVQVPQCRFYFFGGEGATTTLRRRDVATNLRLPGPSPITPRDRIPREGPPHLDVSPDRTAERGSSEMIQNE